jgi:hypothetical protein
MEKTRARGAGQVVSAPGSVFIRVHPWFKFLHGTYVKPPETRITSPLMNPAAGVVR